MRDYTFLQMWEPFRQSLIDGHLFYVEQAHKRLLSQFDDMEAEADRASEEWLEQHGYLFNPDQHDPEHFCEAAHDAGIRFYELLSDMRDRTYLSVVAGMFHEWDKQLRDWLVREIQHWHRGNEATAKVWAVDFGNIADLLEGAGWKVRKAIYFSKLDACRLLVNVYKHGEGKSLDELKQSYPEYFYRLGDSSELQISEMAFTDHTHLRVTDQQFQAFSDAILAFWKDVPEEILASQVVSIPGWFKKALLMDRGP